MPDKRSRFSALFTPVSAKTHPLRLVFQAKSPVLATLSRKRGKKAPILRPQRNHPDTPRLWPHLAGIARLAKTALLP
jgi:hypothetical protein